MPGRTGATTGARGAPAAAATPNPGPLVDNLIDLGAKDLRGEDNAAAAEAWGSHVMGMFQGVRLAAHLQGDEAPPFEEAMLERCRHRRDQNALLVATALAAVVPPALQHTADRAVAELRQVTTGPAWLDTVGQADATRAWLATDVFGDQDAVIVAFTPPPPDVGTAPPEHALVVLVDHNLSGQAKDAWIGEDPDGIAAAWSSQGEPGLRVDAVPVDIALVRLREAMTASDLWNGDVELRTDDFADNRALVWARLRRAGFDHPAGPGGPFGAGTPEVSPEERDALVADFLGSGHATACRTAGVSAEDLDLVARVIVGLRCDYEGRPLRWSPTVVRALLTDLAPRKVLLHDDQAAALPAVLRALVAYAGERTGLDAMFVAEILEAVDEAEPDYLAQMGDPGAAGPAKAVMAALQAAGVDLGDPDAIAAALEDLDPLSLPLPSLPPPLPLSLSLSSFGDPAPRGAPRPKPFDAPPEVVAAAEATTALARFAALVDFYGEGRKLTATGQPTLADARALVGLLATDDRLDEQVGDRVFRTTTAAALPELSFTIRWAIAAGALRKDRGRLRATAAWSKLDAKPVARWVKAAESLVKLGPLASRYRKAYAGFRQMAEFVDGLIPDLLYVLSPGPMPFDAALDLICDEADATFEWTTGFWVDPAARRRSFAHDLDRLLEALDWAGIVQRADFTLEPDKWEPDRSNKIGGTIGLTPAGRWWLAAHV